MFKGKLPVTTGLNTELFNGCRENNKTTNKVDIVIYFDV